MLVPFGLVVGSMKFWSSGDFTSGPGTGPLMMAWIFSPLIGLGIVVYGVREGWKAHREAARWEGDEVWYSLTDQGVSYPEFLSPRNDFLAQWAWVRGSDPGDGTGPRVRLRCRFPGARIDRNVTLKSYLLSADGARFADRLRVWVDAKAPDAAGPSPPGVAEKTAGGGATAVSSE